MTLFVIPAVYAWFESKAFWWAVILMVAYDTLLFGWLWLTG